MVNRISLLKKKRFFQKKDKIIRKIVFSPLLVIPLVLVFISSVLIKSVQREFLQSDFLNHLFTGLLGYFLAIFISYIPCLLYTSPSPRDLSTSRMPSSA